ncbi:MAG: 30S ribosomal protein S18 [Planctomycetota bacterium]|nr:MAG: 30S ribosomal protein S18 [Planctomycetota bacterium]
MATLTKADIKKIRKRRARLRKKLRCRFCPDGCDKSPRPVYVDYKDVRTLRSMLNRNGQILSRRRTGNCAKYQHAVRRAIIRARYIALLPYIAEE